MRKKKAQATNDYSNSIKINLGKSMTQAYIKFTI